MTREKLMPALAAILLLSACGGKDETEAPADVPAEAEGEGITLSADPDLPVATPTVVSVADTLGDFEGEVSSLAFWQHPSIPFRSAILAANGDAGLFVIPMEEGGTPTHAEGKFDGGVAVTYLPGRAIVAAFEMSTGEIRFFDIDPDTRELTQAGALRAPEGADSLCFGGTVLLRIDENGAQHMMDLDVTGETIIGTSEPLAGPTAKGCASAGHDIYVLAINGSVVLANTNGEPAAAEVPPSNPRAVSIAAVETPDGAVFLSLLPDGTLEVGRDGIPVRGFADDNDMVLSQAMASSGGNFGGVYRSGIVGILTVNNQLKLIPWLGIANAVGIETATVSPWPPVPVEPASAERSVPAIAIPDLPEVSGDGE